MDIDIDHSDNLSIASSVTLQNKVEVNTDTNPSIPSKDLSEIRAQLASQLDEDLRAFTLALDNATKAMQEPCDWIKARSEDPTIDAEGLEGIESGQEVNMDADAAMLGDEELVLRLNTRLENLKIKKEAENVEEKLWKARDDFGLAFYDELGMSLILISGTLGQ
jgi:formiminotetrahydrofolate cyclodeaminase